jgi:hypothetical protein
VYGLSHCRMQPQVLEMHQSTESSSSAKTPAQSSSSSSTNNNNHTEKDQVSSASSSRSSSPMPQWNQNSLSVKLTPNRPKTRKGKMRGRPPKHLSSWPRVPNLDYQTGISLEVECRRVIATVTEYQLQQSWNIMYMTWLYLFLFHLCFYFFFLLLFFVLLSSQSKILFTEWIKTEWLVLY